MTFHINDWKIPGFPKGSRQPLYMLGMLAITLVLILGIILGSALKSGKRTDGLYYQAAGIRPDAQLLRIEDQIISAEEYLYWLAYDCEYLIANAGQIDFSAQVTEDMTYAQYVKADALETVKLYAIIRQWAEDNNIQLTEDDLNALAAEREQMVTYYGDEKTYLQQVQILGISEEAFDAINSVYYLYARVFREYTEGSLRPTDAQLTAYGQSNGFHTAQLLFLSTEGMDETALAAQKATAEEYAKQLKEAEDVAAKYAELAAQMNLPATEVGQTFTADQADSALIAALDAMQDGQVSDVIQTEKGFYVAIRMPLDLTALAKGQFDDRLAQARAGVQIQYNERLYNSIDAGSFYEKLSQGREKLAETFSANNPNDSDDAAGSQANNSQN
ncbi:MAG: peptidyl-prolyl cis-trans isomerase [Ruminococcaceae bacterium]|nr:peptidyl-prolyl cis-trans isomerase [Oscillospiraceae bacterium]